MRARGHEVTVNTPEANIVNAERLAIIRVGLVAARGAGPQTRPSAAA